MENNGKNGERKDRKDRKDRQREAIALEYSPESAAPKIIAAGRGYVAERILREAEENKIPVHRDAELAKTLNLLKIGDEIPPELYTVVAQVLIFVGSVDKQSHRGS